MVTWKIYFQVVLGFLCHETLNFLCFPTTVIFDKASLSMVGNKCSQQCSSPKSPRHTVPTPQMKQQNINDCIILLKIELCTANGRNLIKFWPERIPSHFCKKKQLCKLCYCDGQCKALCDLCNICKGFVGYEYINYSTKRICLGNCFYFQNG